ncbi:hypothetical protein [Desulfonatronum thioautotrophicum]|uniref:hypothetical protein n=1 Tax=Desulfonatronum thioautotrophicum TaxID=617001 RepID=UPI0012947AFB|nr:hypothetical protein [Desulfonatronum thioautotrophicum]
MLQHPQVIAVAVLAFAVGVLAFVAGCTPKPPALLLEPRTAETAWSRFQEAFLQDCPTEDFSLRASVNYSSPERHSRFIISMWGRTDFPIRLDVQAGVGAMLAHWREDQDEWLGYIPSTQEAFIADTVKEGARITGLFMPMRLNTLNQLLLGCWQAIIPTHYESVEIVGNTLEYSLLTESSPLILALAPSGQPVTVRNPEPGGWIARIEQWEDNVSFQPRRISLHQEDQSAVIRIQRLESPTTPWMDKDLRLDIPPGTTIWTMSQ